MKLLFWWCARPKNRSNDVGCPLPPHYAALGPRISESTADAANLVNPVAARGLRASRRSASSRQNRQRSTRAEKRQLGPAERVQHCALAAISRLFVAATKTLQHSPTTRSLEPKASVRGLGLECQSRRSLTRSGQSAADWNHYVNPCRGVRSLAALTCSSRFSPSTTLRTLNPNIASLILTSYPLACCVTAPPTSPSSPVVATPSPTLPQWRRATTPANPLRLPQRLTVALRRLNLQLALCWLSRRPRNLSRTPPAPRPALQRSGSIAAARSAGDVSLSPLHHQKTRPMCLRIPWVPSAPAWPM